MKNSEMLNSDEKAVGLNGNCDRKLQRDSSDGPSIKNFNVNELFDGVLQIEFQMNGASYTGSVFASDIDDKILCNARSMYEKSKLSQKGIKRRGRKFGSRNKRQIIANPGSRGRPGKAIKALSNKIIRELDEFEFHDDQTLTEYKPEIKTYSETTNSSTTGKDDFEEDVNESSQPGDKKQEEQYSDISDASKDSPASSTGNGLFDMKTLCKSSKRESEHVNPTNMSPLNPPPVKMEAKSVFPQQNSSPHVFPQQKVTDNYAILKENRDMPTVFNNKPTEVQRPQTFASKPQQRNSVPENFCHRPGYNPGMVNNISPNDLTKFMHHLLTNGGIMNTAAMLNAYPYLAMARGFNPGNIPQNGQIPNIPVFEPFNQYPRGINYINMMQRFPQNNPNPRNQGNQNGTNKFRRD